MALYTYAANVGPDQFTQVEFIRDTGERAIIIKGLTYDLTTTEAAKLANKIVLNSGVAPAYAVSIVPNPAEIDAIITQARAGLATSAEVSADLDAVESSVAQKPDKTSLPVNVLDHGADRTGATSSVAAFAAAVAACIPATDPATTTREATRALYVPAGIYAGATAVLSLVSVQGFRLITDGARNTVFKATANMDSVVDLNGVSRSRFDTFSVQTASGVIVDHAVHLFWNSAAANRSTLENHIDVELSSCTCVTGMRWGREGDTNQVDSTSAGHLSLTGGWNAKAVTGVAATDLFTSTAHGLVAGDQVVWTDKTGGAGITLGTTYFVIASGLTTDDFKVSTTLGGSAVDLTSAMTAGTVGYVDRWQSGLKVGHAATGNNFLHDVQLLAVTGFRRNLHMARASLHIGTAQFQAGEVDVYIDGPMNWGLSIDNGRSENSQRFIEGAGYGTVPHTLRISDYQWRPSAIHSDGRWILNYSFPGSVIFDNVSMGSAPAGGVVPKIHMQPTRRLHFFARGLGMQQDRSTAFEFSSSVDDFIRGYSEQTANVMDATQPPKIRYAVQIPKVVLPTAADGQLLPQGVIVPGANIIRGCRVIIPEAGQLKDFSWAVGASAGNIIGIVYDTGDASAGNYTKLWDSGTVAVGTANQWQILGSPDIWVEQGQHLVFAIILSDAATASYGRCLIASSTSYIQLPTGFMPADGGASPKLGVTNSPGIFTAPTPVAEASFANHVHIPMLIARIA